MEARGLGPAAEAVSLLWRVDSRNRTTLGVAKERLAISMYDTYRALVEKAGAAPDPVVRDECFARLGTIVNHRYRLVWGARKVLSACVAYGHHLVLYTRGDRELQQRKIRQAGIIHHFCHAEILDRKGLEQLQDLLSRLGISASDAWMVGDEIRADIEPALALGMRAIRVWGYHEAEPAPLPVSDLLYNVRIITHVLPILCPRFVSVRERNGASTCLSKPIRSIRSNVVS